MPVRSLFASLIVVGLIAGGAIFVMARQHVGLAEYVALLQMRAPNASLLCWIFGWGAATSAVLAVLTAFAAFLEEEEDDGYRRRGFPKGLPIVFLLIALALFWAALACVRQPRERVVIPIDRSAQIAPADVAGADAEDELAGASSDEAPLEPGAEPERAPPAAPRVMAIETALVWEYKYPLVLGERYVYSPRMSEAIAALFPAADPNGDVRAMLCGKAWVALTGSASEEGPRDRNERRARRRAEMVAGAANDWLDAHRGCERPIVLAVTLGQHAATAARIDDAGRSTGYQRQTFILSRDRVDGETLDHAAAAREARAYLRDDLDALLGGRQYLSPPVVLEP